MLKRLLLAAALAAGFASPALAQQQWPGVTVYDLRGQPLGTSANPLYVAGGTGGGGGGATGSVTAAGTNGTLAQAIQGINGGVPVPVTGSFSSAAAPGSQEQDVRSTTGTLNAASTSSTLDIPVNGQATVGLRFSGLTASGATVSYFQSIDGTTFTVANENNTGTGALSPTRTTDGQVRINAAGRTTIRLQVTTAGTGTISVASNVSVRAFSTSIDAPLPPGANVIGSIGNTAFGISGTLPAFASTPTFNIGTTNGLALDSTLSGVATTNSAISTATGTTADAATASGANSTIIGALRAIRDRLFATLTTTVSSSALPTGAATSANQTTEITALQAIQQRAAVFSEQSNASVAVSGTLTGTSRDAGATPLYTKFNAVVSSTQSGTLFLQGSNDNFTTLVGVASVATTANVPAYLTAPVMFRYHRYVFGNGTTAATVSVNTSYTAN